MCGTDCALCAKIYSPDGESKRCGSAYALHRNQVERSYFMRVLLVNPSTGYYTRTIFNPLGLVAIGSYLRSIGHEVMLEDRCVHKENMNTIIKHFQPDMVGLSLMSSRVLKDALKVSKAAKKHGLYVSWGGAMASMHPDLLLGNDCIDSVIFSEGEYTFRDMLEALEGKRSFSSVQGLIFKENGNIIHNEPRPFADLGEFPASDYSLIKVEKYVQPYLGSKRMMYVYSSKGCPCHCAFCPNSYYHHSCHRKRPNEIVLQDIRFLVENYGVDGIYFSDELWVTKKSDMLDFCARVKELGLHFYWGIQARVGMFDEHDFQIMYDAGCRWAFFGIESGSRSRSDKIHKNIDFDKIVPTFRILRKLGITTVASFIIGFPEETQEELKQTCELILQVDANLTPVYHFTPLPGTELYRELVADGKYKPIRTMKDLSKNIATESMGQNLSNVPAKELKVIRNWFIWKGFTRKDSVESSKNFTFALETILHGLTAISQKGILMFFHDGFTALKEFIYIYWYAHMYPGIRKKYGLNRHASRHMHNESTKI